MRSALLALVLAAAFLDTRVVAQASGSEALQPLAEAGIRHLSPYPIVADRAKLGAYETGFNLEDSGDDYPPMVAGHPQLLASWGGHALSKYLAAPSAPEAAAHLARARSYADFLITQARTIDGAWMFPYDLDTKHYEGRWFSGLAQGSALSLFSELAHVTGSARYRRAADLTFRSFFLFRPEPYTHDEWISNVDEHGYYWVEEYPRDSPEHVLNGHQFAIVGLHKYYMLTRDPAAEYLVRAGVATMAHYAEALRNPGWLSSKRVLDGRGERAAFFSLKHSYHLIHIDLYRYAFAMSGDPAIAEAIAGYLEDEAAFQRVLATVGSVRMDLAPAQAVAAGAAWRRADAHPASSVVDYFNPADWHAGGNPERGVVPGTYTVEFRDAGPQWEAPPPVRVTLEPKGAVARDARYTRRYLDDRFEPEERGLLIRRFEGQVEENPRHGEAHFALGQLYQLSGDTARAEAAYRASDAIGWGPLPALYLARLLQPQGRTDEALEQYDRALALCGRCRPWHAEKAGILIARGDTEAAIAAYRRSIDAPDGSVAQSYALHGWLRSNDLAGPAKSLAAATLEAASRTPPADSQSLYLLGALQTRLRNWEGAAGYLERAVAAAPRFRNARQLLGSTYLRLGRFDDAITQYEGAATVRPRSPETLDDLARVYADVLARRAGDEDAVARLCARARIHLPSGERPAACRRPGPAGAAGPAR